MKNIAILIPSLKPGGAEKQATLLANVLDKHYNVDLYLLHGNVDIGKIKCSSSRVDGKYVI